MRVSRQYPRCKTVPGSYIGALIINISSSERVPKVVKRFTKVANEERKNNIPSFIVMWYPGIGGIGSTRMWVINPY